MRPRVTVIIPAYNHQEYVAEALESVLGQSRPPDRVLAIDDGSSDDTLAVLRSFESRRVEVLTQANAGTHAALNRGVAAARDCEVVAILNSDDRFHPDRLRVCLEELDRSPATEVVATEYRLIDAQGSQLDAHSPQSRWQARAWAFGRETGNDVATWIGRACFPAGTSNLVARSAYLQANPFGAYRYAHDYLFFAQAALRGCLGVVRRPLLDKREHDRNLMREPLEGCVREVTRMTMLLHASLATELRDAAVRDRMRRFLRAAWSNIGGLDLGLFHLLVAELAARTDAAEVERIVAEWTVDELPELATGPTPAPPA